MARATSSKKILLAERPNEPGQHMPAPKSIRRKDGRTTDQISVDGFSLNATYRTLTTPDQKEFRLTATEFRLLQCFLRSPDRVFSQDELVESLYNIERCPTRNVVQVYITRLRKIIGVNKIKTLRGQGYYFEKDPNR